jgi:hypothetical protein
MIEVLNYKAYCETIEVEGVKPRIDNFKENMAFNIKHNTVKEKVKSILRKDKYSRKNDFYLCLLYWIQNGDITMNVDFKDFKKICKPETISRIRRELISDAKKGNNELKWLLNDLETLDERDNLYNLNHDYYQDKNNSKIAEVIK